MRDKQQELDLLDKLRQGDPRTVQVWFEEYSPKMKKIAFFKVNDSAVADELVQETFINCLRQLHLFKGKSTLWTWMSSILRHEIADYYRKIYAKKAIRVLPLSDLLLSVSITDAHDTSDKVKSVLDKMAGENKELLMLKYVDKKKVKEIAEYLGKSVKSVESDLFRARGEFKEAYARQ